MTAFDIRKMIRPLITLIAVIVAMIIIVHLWNYYNQAPWTRDGRVSADVIEISSDISGLVTEVLVQDNETVKQGQPIFRIDTARQQLNVAQARSDLAKTRSGWMQAKANLLAAEANLKKSKASTQLAEKNAERYSNLMGGAVSKQERDEILATRDQAHAEDIQFSAAIEQAKAAIAQQAALIDVAQSQLDLAELNLKRSEVIAPTDGTLSNFSLTVGNYIKIGDPVAALLDRKKVYILGYFEETKIKNIHVGDAAIIELMGDSHKIKGHVQGIASGIEDREKSASSGLLANINPTFTWVRLAQRIPVKIVIDEPSKSNLALIAGRTATVHIVSDKNKK